MGGTISNIRKKNEIEEDEQKIKNYEQATENDRYGFAFENEDGRDIKWWQYLIYDIRFRIAYALAIAIIVGVVIPIVVYFAFFNKDDITIYGSCLTVEDARFQCLINNFEPVDEASCADALCCWETNETRSFKCYHTFPSAYQYQVSSVQLFENENTQTDSAQKLFNRARLQIQPNHPDKMSALSIWIDWIEENHLNIQMFNPKDFPDKTSTQQNNLFVKQGEMDAYGVVVEHGEDNGYFFMRLGRNGSQETIFDTRLGPINSGKGFISFSTTLPTPYFYGLRGGEGNSNKGTLTYGVVNGFENAELPFYMSLENSGLWHAVLLDTTNPFIVQVLQAPAIMFHVEGSTPLVNLHIFTGSSKEQVLQQLHKHIASKTEIDTRPYIPPYWGLGLHLCHKSENGSMALKHILALNKAISYDSDCIDEDLRDPFGLDTTKFDNIEEIVEAIINSTKKIVLSQKLSLKWNETQASHFEDLLVTDKTNTSDIHPYTGVVDNQTVYYPDIFNPNFSANLTQWGLDLSSIPFSGMILTDNFPKNENATSTCKKAETFLENIFLNGSSITNSNRNQTWGSICPNIVHKVGLGTNSSGESSSMGTTEKAHLELHNIYGLEALKKLSKVAVAELKIQNRETESILLSSSSGWTESLYYGSHNGIEVPFTWLGLRESLAHTLRHFVLYPFSGTSICGSYLPNESPVGDAELCLRWYQLGLLLPFAYHSYGNGNVSRGPLDFSPSYQGYLNEAIRQRYSFAPYYYSLSKKYLRTFVPAIVPVSYYFNDAFKEGLVDQFMVGEALLAAPIMQPSLTRSTYFPPGVWYGTDGYIAWNNSVIGGPKIVTGYITQTPLFVRGGYIIPTLQNPGGRSIIESLSGNYTLLIGLLSNDVASGVLYLDDGAQVNTLNDEISFEVTNTLNDSDIIMNLTMNSSNTTCDTLGDNISTRVDQIKILGFPIKYKNINISVDGQSALGDELDMLRVYNLNLDWCQHSYIHVTISAFID